MKIINASLNVPSAQVENWNENPRDIKPRDFERLKKQITELGVYKPLLCEKVGKTYVALGGNMRLKALKDLGEKQIWITEIKVKDQAERVKVSLSDNDRAGFYLQDALAEQLKTIEFKELQNYKVDVRAPDVSMADILDRARDALQGEDDVPFIGTGPAVAKRGDLYALGDHRLLCGDALNPDDWNTLMDYNKSRAACCFTDPPYNVAYRGPMNVRRDKIKNDNMTRAAFADFLDAAMARIIDNTDGGCYVCMKNTNIDILKAAWEKAGGFFSGFIIWIKSSFVLSNGDYHQGYEPILYGWPKMTKAHYFTGDRTRSNVWEDLKAFGATFDGKTTTIEINGFKLKLVGKVEGEIQKRNAKIDIWRYNRPTRSEQHPTMKPVAMIEEAICNSSERGQIVVDPFHGSGSTTIACEKQGRRCYAMELDEKYVDTAIKRWEDWTKQKAVKL